MRIPEGYIVVQKALYDKYADSDVKLNVLKNMAQEAETMEDLIAILKINEVEVNEELCRLVS